MVRFAYAGPVRPAAALRDSVLRLPPDIHSLLVNTPSSSSPPPPQSLHTRGYDLAFFLAPVLRPGMDAISQKLNSPALCHCHGIMIRKPGRAGQREREKGREGGGEALLGNNVHDGGVQGAAQ